MKKKYLWRKTISLLLAGAMMLGCVEPLCTQAAGGDAGADLSALNASKVLELKFDDLDLGTSEKLQPENMTVAFWLKATKTLAGEHIIMWNKPDGAWDGQGWYLSCLSDTVPLKLSVGSNQEKLTEYAVNTNRAEFFPIDEWVHIAVTYNRSQISGI